ncbi:MAG: hypothetical protein U0X20_12400 [Caldilineaceae bacterium]
MPAHRSVFSHVLCLALVCVIAAALAVVPVVPAAAAPPVTPPAPDASVGPDVGTAIGTTPFQQSLAAALAARTAAGLPTPAVATTYALAPAAGQAAARVTATTTIEFGSPAEAGYTLWPSFTVGGQLPPGARGSSAAGRYDEQIQAAVAAAHPGVWEQYAYGREPRTYVVAETLALAPRPAAPAAAAAVSDATAGEVVLGFTVSGPDLDYAITGAWQIFGVTVAEARAGIALGWGAGLRLPLAATLTLPAALSAGEVYTPTTALGGRDWAPADYTAVGLAAEDGNEFVLRYAFVVGASAKILGATVVDWSLADLRFDASRSFTTPLGSGAAFPIPALDLGPDATGLRWDLATVLSVGVGFVVDPAVGSDKITARWQAGTLSGTLTYGAAGVPVEFGPLDAGAFAPGGPAAVQISDFRYWFTQFLVKLGGYLQFDLFGYGARSGTFSIAQLDLHDLTGGLYLGAHAGTGGTVAAVVDRSPICTAAAPTVARLWPVDNRLVAVGITGITDPDDPPVRARSTFGGPVADPPTVTITAISQDEPVDDPIDPTAGQAGEPVGDYYGPDGSGLGSATAWLRAQSDPHGNGRVYHVTYVAADAAGASCTGSVRVGVPPADAGDTAPVDDGGRYDATAASVRPLFITLLRK